jgi:hypothetical protein
LEELLHGSKKKQKAKKQNNPPHPIPPLPDPYMLSVLDPKIYLDLKQQQKISSVS